MWMISSCKYTIRVWNIIEYFIFKKGFKESIRKRSLFWLFQIKYLKNIDENIEMQRI